MQVTPNSLFSNLVRYSFSCYVSARVLTSITFLAETHLQLPNEPNHPLITEELDFSRNYVGDRGLVPIIKVLELCPMLKVLRLKNNGLRNKSIEALCTSLKQNPGSLCRLDLSHNYISTGAGKQLEALLKENTTVREINLEATKIEPEIRIRIMDTLAKR